MLGVALLKLVMLGVAPAEFRYDPVILGMVLDKGMAQSNGVRYVI